ncbi:MAG: hypothetical protein IPO83_03150 [Chitinophagaceae bacterium]|nr:hypothetical protein [Chitinophagaceae bacterium]
MKTFLNQNLFNSGKFFLNCLSAVLLLIFPLQAVGQYQEKAIVFEIFRGQDKIGTVVAISIADGAKQMYRIETHVDVRVVFSFKADIVVRNTFMNNVLTDAYAKRVLNGTVKVNNSILKQDVRYQMVNKDRDTTFYKGTINYCVSQLYFEEPVNKATAFSEAFLQQVPLSKSNKGTYELKLPDGNVNHYTYINGECTEVAIETQLSNVRLVRVIAPGKG